MSISPETMRCLSLARLARLFPLIAALVLLLTSVSKLATVFFVNSATVDKEDAVLYFLTTRQVLSLAALFELVGVTVLMSTRLPQITKLACMACMASGFLAYRVIHYYVTDGMPCGCLGQLHVIVPLVTPHIASRVSLILLGFLYFSSYALLISQSPHRTTFKPAKTNRDG